MLIQRGMNNIRAEDGAEGRVVLIHIVWQMTLVQCRKYRSFEIVNDSGSSDVLCGD